METTLGGKARYYILRKHHGHINMAFGVRDGHGVMWRDGFERPPLAGGFRTSMVAEAARREWAEQDDYYPLTLIRA